MKKILLSILIILILTLTYVGFSKGISAGFIKINSIENIKLANEDLEKDFSIANQLANITYLEEISKLEDSITKLKSTKQEFKNKNSYSEGNELIETTQIKTYTVHYLWTILGNYQKDRNLKSLNLDLKTGQGKDIYNLEFTLIGNYVGITDFIYDIENDEELNFEIQNLKLSSKTAETSSSTQNSQTNTTTQTTTGDGKTIQATFFVKDVGITLE